MSSPFDYAKSVTHTKESLYTTEQLFQKEYNAFLVNRSLSNSGQTALFADIINQFPGLDTKLQYDFYLYGVPKQKGYAAWAKKQTQDVDKDVIEYVSTAMCMSVGRTLEFIELVGIEAVREQMDKRGGR